MKQLLGTALVLSIVAVGIVAAQTTALVKEVRSAIAAKDLTSASKAVATFRAANGVTPEMLEGLSWLGRGALGANDLEAAERYARETYQLSIGLLKNRPLDREPRLPIALGAAIEVLSQADAARGARTEAVTFLQKESRIHKGTSIEKRIQKNLNLLTLEGQAAPAVDLSEYLGAKPPSVASLKGAVVLMFFWAHWCGDCKAQAPILAELVNKYRDHGLVVFAPTQRFGYVAGGKPAPADEEMKYIDQVRQTFYPVLAGQPVPVGETNHIRYGVSSTPTLVLVDRAGIIRLYHPGRMPLEELDARIRPLIAEQKLAEADVDQRGIVIRDTLRPTRVRSPDLW